MPFKLFYSSFCVPNPSFTLLLDAAENREGEEQQAQDPVDPDLPIRQYLDKHIMPSLIEALEKLTTDKPEDPIQYIGEYLLKEEDKLKQGAAAAQ